MLSNDLIDLRLCTDLNLDLSLVNVPNHILVRVILSSIPEITAELGSAVVVEFIKDRVKLDLGDYAHIAPLEEIAYLKKSCSEPKC